jgi:hypothetical protein
MFLVKEGNQLNRLRLSKRNAEISVLCHHEISANMRAAVEEAVHAILEKRDQQPADIRFLDEKCECSMFQSHAIFEAISFLYATSSPLSVDTKNFESWMHYFCKNARKTDSKDGKKDWALCERDDCGKWQILPKGLKGNEFEVFTCDMIGRNCILDLRQGGVDASQPESIEIAHLRKELTDIKREYTNMVDLEKEAKRQQKLKDTELQDMKSEIQDLKDALDRKDAELRSKLEEIDNLRGARKVDERQIKRVQDELQVLQAQANNNIEREQNLKETELRDMKSEIQDLKDALDRKDAELRSKLEEIDNLRGARKVDERQIKRVQDELQVLQAQANNNIEREQNLKETELRDMKSEIQDLKDALDRKDAELRSKLEEIDNLRGARKVDEQDNNKRNYASIKDKQQTEPAATADPKRLRQDNTQAYMEDKSQPYMEDSAQAYMEFASLKFLRFNEYDDDTHVKKVFKPLLLPSNVVPSHSPPAVGVAVASHGTTCPWCGHGPICSANVDPLSSLWEISEEDRKSLIKHDNDGICLFWGLRITLRAANGPGSISWEVFDAIRSANLRSKTSKNNTECVYVTPNDASSKDTFLTRVLQIIQAAIDHKKDIRKMSNDKDDVMMRKLYDYHFNHDSSNSIIFGSNKLKKAKKLDLVNKILQAILDLVKESSLGWPDANEWEKLDKNRLASDANLSLYNFYYFFHSSIFYDRWKMDWILPVQDTAMEKRYMQTKGRQGGKNNNDIKIFKGPFGNREFLFARHPVHRERVIAELDAIEQTMEHDLLLTLKPNQQPSWTWYPRGGRAFSVRVPEPILTTFPHWMSILWRCPHPNCPLRICSLAHFCMKCRLVFCCSGHLQLRPGAGTSNKVCQWCIRYEHAN